MPAPSAKDIWKKTWNSPGKRQRLIIIIVLIPVFFAALPYFFNYIEKRNGVLLHDWVLAKIPPHNVSVVIFAIIWSMILLTLYRSLYSPSIFITYCFTLALVTIARITCISLVPLTPPAGLIPLTDPISGIFYGEATITKDLFFSGHTATLATIFFCLERKTDKLIAFAAMIALAILLVIQHIHYTIDILTAPVVVYVLYRVTCRFLFKEGKQQDVLD
jgi:hypothetical protein